ncbi:ABC transporter permease [Carboxylicivirga sp. M1479]|uniref:ABC transporter permease n=1 Tax=Carboxylicivirga sp. M1479 TaxID=2594476 RepID=UPI001177E458|nr:ABC transporter permease [Carboxylicivirga sp. M1479]TRX72663.1 FtsX-like permease family protein [Carboxylicivirga sp. M1479]
MYALKLAFRSLFVKGQLSIIRIISLAAGLAFGILLLSEVFFYNSYDRFYPNADRIYNIQSDIKMNDKSEFELYPRVSGAIAPGLKAEVPGVEAATRLNSIGKQVFYTQSKERHIAKVVFADAHLYEVLPRPMISGTADEVLATPMACMVSHIVANKMGGDVIGLQIELKQFPGKELNILGVFEALPNNTNFTYDVIVPMQSLDQFMWDGSNNWLGNDRYFACVKLMPDVHPNSLNTAIRKMQEKHQDILQLEQEQGGVFLRYSLVPLLSMQTDAARHKMIILCTIALAVLFVSLLNYILLTLSALVNRAKLSAIHKTCGAQSNNLQQLIFAESFLLFLASVGSALLIIWSIKPFAEQYLGHSLEAAINPYVVWPILGLLLLMVVLSSYLPGRFFANIPVTAAFRSYQQKKNKWKLGLLAVQFIGVSFIVTVMVVVTLQYNNMVNAGHGYRAKGIYYGSTIGMDGTKVGIVVDQLRTMPEVAMVGFGTEMPISGASGNNVMAPDNTRELFNVADFYFIDQNYMKILDIPLRLGNGFNSADAHIGDVMISQKGADKLLVNNGWDDGVLGQQLRISEHGETTIRGVYNDFVIGSMSSPDTRASVFFYVPEDHFKQARIEDPTLEFLIVVRVHEQQETGVFSKIERVFNDALPHNDAVIKSLENEQMELYAGEKSFRNAMLAGNLIILLTTIIGLLGYTTNEATRRRKELAIRRINGASLTNILRVFIIDLQLVAVPAIAIGLLGAWIMLERWMQNFASKIPLHWSIFVSCSLAIIVLVSLIAMFNYVRIANRNPVEALRYE